MAATGEHVSKSTRWSSAWWRFRVSREVSWYFLHAFSWAIIYLSAVDNNAKQALSVSGPHRRRRTRDLSARNQENIKSPRRNDNVTLQSRLPQTPRMNDAGATGKNARNCARRKRDRETENGGLVEEPAVQKGSGIQIVGTGVGRSAKGVIAAQAKRFLPGARLAPRVPRRDHRLPTTMNSG